MDLKKWRYFVFGAVIGSVVGSGIVLHRFLEQLRRSNICPDICDIYTNNPFSTPLS